MVRAEEKSAMALVGTAVVSNGKANMSKPPLLMISSSVHVLELRGMRIESQLKCVAASYLRGRVLDLRLLPWFFSPLKQSMGFGVSISHLPEVQVAETLQLRLERLQRSPKSSSFEFQ